MADTENMNFKSREDRLKELTDQLEVGVKSVRSSAEFKTLLATMAKFPHYSLNNCILISMQHHRTESHSKQQTGCRDNAGKDRGSMPPERCSDYDRLRLNCNILCSRLFRRRFR